MCGVVFDVVQNSENIIKHIFEDIKLRKCEYFWGVWLCFSKNGEIRKSNSIKT